MSMDYEQNVAPKSSRSYILTLVMALLLGGLGIHRFYTGYVVIGVIQLLTCGGFGWWALIDLIALALNKYVDAEGNELEGHNAGCGLIVLLIIVLTFIIGGLCTLPALITGFAS